MYDVFIYTDGMLLRVLSVNKVDVEDIYSQSSQFRCTQKQTRWTNGVMNYANYKSQCRRGVFHAFQKKTKLFHSVVNELNGMISDLYHNSPWVVMNLSSVRLTELVLEIIGHVKCRPISPSIFFCHLQEHIKTNHFFGTTNIALHTNTVLRVSWIENERMHESETTVDTSEQAQPRSLLVLNF